MNLLPVVGLVHLGWNEDTLLNRPLQNINVAMHVSEQARSTIGTPISHVSSILLLPMSPGDQDSVTAILQAALEDNRSLLTVKSSDHWRFVDPSTGECQELFRTPDALIAQICGNRAPENRYTPGVAYRLPDSAVAGDLLPRELRNGCLSSAGSEKVVCVWGESVAVLSSDNLLQFRSYPSYEAREKALKRRFRGHKRTKDGDALVFRVARKHTTHGRGGGSFTSWQRDGRKRERWDRSDECLVLRREKGGIAHEEWGFCHDVTTIPAAQKSRRR